MERTEAAMQALQEGLSARNQRAFRPAMVRGVLSIWPNGYRYKRPTPLLALLRDLGQAACSVPLKAPSSKN